MGLLALLLASTMTLSLSEVIYVVLSELEEWKNDNCAICAKKNKWIEYRERKGGREDK